MKREHGRKYSIISSKNMQTLLYLRPFGSLTKIVTKNDVFQNDASISLTDR
jgi:hypothetical protein